MTWMTEHKHAVRAAILAVIAFPVMMMLYVSGQIVWGTAVGIVSLLLLWSLRWDAKNPDRGGTHEPGVGQAVHPHVIGIVDHDAALGYDRNSHRA